eukprot:TCONS_00026815-protein
MYHNNNAHREYRLPSIHDLLKQSKIWKQPNLPEIKRRKLVIQEHTKNFNARLIHNLSDHNLTNEEHLVLCRGLNYSPGIPQFKFQSNPTQVYNNLKRHIDIKMYFDEEQQNNNQQDNNNNQQDNNNNQLPKLPKKRKSDWTPPATQNETINHFFEQLYNSEIEPRPTERRQHRHILTPYNSLLNNHNIIIKKADKGGGLVILNKKDYIDKINKEHLNNTDTYQELEDDPTQRITYDVRTTIQYLTLKHYIDNATAKFLQPPDQPRTPIFYGLPKIHKTNNPLRPIVSGFDSPTDNLSRYLAHYLQPLVESLPTYLKDTKHFLQLLDTWNEPLDNITMITADVTSLYTNIPHDEGLNTTTEYYTDHRRLLPDHAPNTTTIKILLDTILTNSNFRFMDKHYLQKSGTTMGGRYAPQYANLFMGKIETQIINEFTNNVLLWRRFIDDIFIIFKGNNEELAELKSYMNLLHPTIKFTFDQSPTTINFLDVQITISNNQFSTSIYRKPTDRSQLLHFESNHPLHTKEGIVYSQALRYNMIISDSQTLTNELHNLSKILLARGYPLRIINDNIKKALTKTRHNLLYDNKQHENKNILPLILHNDRDKNIQSKIQDAWSTIEQDADLSNILKRPTTVYKNNKTLGTKLTSSDTKI